MRDMSSGSNFLPRRGMNRREGVGLVLSPRNYNEKSSVALFCPITSKVKGYPFEVLLPPSMRVSGVVLSDQVRSLDWRARRARFEEQAPAQVVREVTEKFSILLP